jgi:hypothetical protein
MNNTTAYRASEFAVGLLFGWGLLISGMTDPGKVLGFLDLAGAWDPSLAFVMGGAVLVGLFAFMAANRRTRSFLGGAMHLPKSNDIDRSLLAGAWRASARARPSCPWPRVSRRPCCSSWPCWPAWACSS